jgi:hypothetical protein
MPCGAMSKILQGDVANATQQISEGDIRQVALRMRQTLQPGINALVTLAPLVPDASKIEDSAIGFYDATRKEARPPGTLRDRINRLLAMPHLWLFSLMSFRKLSGIVVDFKFSRMAPRKFWDSVAA